FYLAIEELPLAAEESHDPKRDIPRAAVWGLTTLVITGALIFLLNPAVGGGAKDLGNSATPLFDGFKAVFGSGTGAALLALIGLVVSYDMQCASFIFLRRRLPNIERPYRSPVGVWGAGIAGVIAVISLISLYANETYRPGVVGTLIYFVIGILYFAIVGRHRLVLSPEEEFALTQGQHGHPETEGYGQTKVADIPAEGATPPTKPQEAPTG